MDVQTITSTTILWGSIIFGVALIGLIAWYWFYIRSFNKKVSIIIQGLSVNKKVFDVAQFYVDENNIGWWKLRKMKDQLPLPPKECIYFDGKGNECCDFVKKGDLDYRALTFIDKEDEKKIGYTPISQQSRIVYGYQFKKSQEAKQKTLGAMIEKYAPYIILAIVAVLAIISYDSIGKKVVEVATVQAGITEQQVKMIDALVQAQLIVNANLANRTVNMPVVPLKG
jgi:hypothetical protein